jgi:hypothetical protein
MRRTFMNWWNDFFQVLIGLQLNPVLRERVLLAKQKVRGMEEENTWLKEALSTVSKQKEELERRIASAPDESRCDRPA